MNITTVLVVFYFILPFSFCVMGSVFSNSSVPVNNSPIINDSITILNESSIIAKTCLCGTSNVGKSCFIDRLNGEPFFDDKKETIGYEIYKHEINGNITLQVWDMGGNTRYNSMRQLYVRNADGILLFYDICNKDSFDELDEWLSVIKDNASEDAIIIIVGNKIDKEDERVITKEEGELYASNNSILYEEISLKTYENIANLMNILTEKVNFTVLAKKERLSNTHVVG